MQQSILNINIRQLVDGFSDNAEEGVWAYGGLLNVRPAYQREFVYKDAQRDAVIQTIREGCTLGQIYFAKNESGYEVLDGQQRIISICQYVNGYYSIEGNYFHSLREEEKNQILDYNMFTVTVCDGTEYEKLKWFRKINIAGAVLTDQELRNAAYAGPWLTDAKRFFSRTGCPAYQLGNKYVKGEVLRQDYLETAISWIIDKPSNDFRTIEDYMSYHQHDANAYKLWAYFNNVVNWASAVFPKYRREMKGIQWGYLYNRYGGEDVDFNASLIEKEVTRLMADEDVTNKKGIYEYILDHEEKHLNIRAFTPRDKRTAYERQAGMCPCCGRHFDIDEMEADHITPWSEGGQTVLDNCQMLCKSCNRAKSNH